MTNPPQSGSDLPYEAVRAAADRSRSAGPWSVAHLRGCWLALGAAGVVLVPIAGVVGGARALIGASVGLAIVGAFFTISTVVIARIGARRPQSVMVVALAVYAVKIVALGAVIVFLPATAPLHPRWMAGGVAVGLVAWMAAHLRYVWVTKIFYVDPK